ncbi:MAG: hypothetical protein IJ055_10530 [Oscillospiraceae bacterium]|nr:hypothetical protein [Oscillospiraceae bacterium]
MELRIIPKGGGKYIINDPKERTIYTVTKAKKLFGNPITTLHDASGYALYTMQRTASGKKPAFDIFFNDQTVIKVSCKSLYVDPSVLFESDKTKIELKGTDDYKDYKILSGRQQIGEMHTERQTNNEPMYQLVIDDPYFDDYIPLLAVAADKCFSKIK